jgi:O-antigen/teichoic acid export membrane protein
MISVATRLRGMLDGALWRATFGGAAVRALSVVLGVAVGIALARTLAPSGYGAYSLVATVVAMLVVVADFGSPQLIVREVAASVARGEVAMPLALRAWGDSIVVRAVGALVVVALAVWAAAQPIGALTHLFAIGMLLVPIVAFTNVRAAATLGLGAPVASMLPELVVRPAALLALLAMWAVSGRTLDPAAALALSVVAALAAFAVAARSFSRRSPEAVPVRPAPAESRRWLASAVPLASTEVIRLLQGHLALLVLGALAASAEVGLFRVAMQVMLLVAMPISILSVVSAPRLAGLHQRADLHELQTTVRQVAMAAWFAVGTLTLLVLVAGPGLIGFAFGVAYREAFQATSVLCIAQAIAAFFGPGAVLLNMSHQERSVTRIFAASLVVTAIGCAFLIPRAGAVGAATAFGVGLISWNAHSWIVARRLLRIDPSAIAWAVVARGAR